MALFLSLLNGGLKNCLQLSLYLSSCLEFHNDIDACQFYKISVSMPMRGSSLDLKITKRTREFATA